MSKVRRKRVTLQDIAVAAGVSVATASVAVTGKRSGNCRVSAEVAERIRRVAHRLNYRPNIQARMLSTQRTHTVAMLVQRSNWHNAMFFLASAQRVLRERGYTEIFLMHPDNSPDSERRHLEMCVDRRVEGIIIMPVIDLERRTSADLINQIVRHERIPLVQLGLAIPGCSVPAVVSDESSGIHHAVRTLHELGHRRIAHVTLRGYDDPSPLNPYRHARLRYAGYASAANALGIPHQVFTPAVAETGVEEAFDRALQLAGSIAALPTSQRPTALVTYSDYEAAGVSAGLARADLRVPGDLSIIGYGDQQFSRMLNPPLATLAPAYEQMGEQATRTLLNMIEGHDGQSAEIPPALIPRESVAPPPH